MNMKEEIYDLDKQYKRRQELLAADSRVTTGNKKLIKKVVEDRIALGNTKSRGLILIDHLRRMARLTTRNFNKFEYNDSVELAKAIEAQKWSPWTKHTCKIIFKSVFRGWNMPPEVYNWIKSEKPPNKLQAEDLLTEEEMNRMIAATDNPMWKAILAVVFETGVRPGEILGMRIRDVIINEVRSKIYVEGKTAKKEGKRAVFAYKKSFSLLKNWLILHPKAKDKDAPLWITAKQQLLKQSSFSQIYSKISKKAGITKEREMSKRAHNNPYLARHSRLTQAYRDYGSVVGAKVAGHKQGSKQIATYVHLSEEDVEEALETHYGLREPKKSEDPLQCPKCEQHSPYGEITCKQCHSALNGAGAVIAETENARELAELKEMKSLLEDPQIISILKALREPDVLTAIKAAVIK